MNLEQELEQQAKLRNSLNKIKESCDKVDAAQYVERRNEVLFNKEINEINKGYGYE